MSIATAAGIALAAGAGMAAGSAMGGSGSQISAPTPLDPNQLGMSSLQAQQNLAGPTLALNQQYSPQYANLGVSTLNQSLFGDSYAGFNAQTYLQQHPDITADWNADPTNQQFWGNIQNYALADAQANNPQALTGPGGLMGIYNTASQQMGQMQSAANTASRQANINDVQNLGAQATQAYQKANPLLTNQMSALSSAVNAAGQHQVGPLTFSNAGIAQGNLAQAGLSQTGLSQANGGPLLGQLTANASGQLGQMTPLEQMEQRQAASLLASNGSLTPAENAQAQDAARSAYADRGLLRSGSGVGAEILDTSQAQYNRLMQNQQLAQGVDASTNAQVNANRGYALGVQSQGQNLSQYNSGLGAQTGMFNAGQANTVGLNNAQMANSLGMYNAGQANQVGMYNAGMNYQNQTTNAQLALQQQQMNLQNQFNLAGMYQNQAVDPYSLVLGQSNAVGQAAGAMGQGGAFTNTGMFDPFNSTIMSMYNTNYNGQNATNIANANSSAALAGAGMSAGSSLASAGLMALAMCWVAREVFGAKSPKWRRFRGWVLTRAPDRLRQLYLRRGERFARLIATRPQLRAAVRGWMEQILAREESLSYGI